MLMMKCPHPLSMHQKTCHAFLVAKFAREKEEKKEQEEKEEKEAVAVASFCESQLIMVCIVTNTCNAVHFGSAQSRREQSRAGRGGWLGCCLMMMMNGCE